MKSYDVIAKTKPEIGQLLLQDWLQCVSISIVISCSITIMNWRGGLFFVCCSENEANKIFIDIMGQIILQWRGE